MNMIKVDGLSSYITLVKDKQFGEVIKCIYELIDRDGFVICKATVDVNNETVFITFLEGFECFTRIQARSYKEKI